MKTLKFLTVIYILLILVSCKRGTTSSPMDLPGEDIKEENWNTAFRLKDDPMLSNSYRNGDILTLRIENLSDSPIRFPDNFGVKVFKKNGNNWEEIQNNFYNASSNYLPVKSTSPLGLVVTVLPSIPQLDSPTNIRIVLVGRYEKSDLESLGAYLDVPLNP